MLLIRKFAAIILTVFAAVSAFAQDEESSLEEVVVTGIRATAGGAQDIDFFRGEVEQARIPHPNTFTAEGLLSQHNIIFPLSTPCDQLFCLSSDYIEADLVAQPEAKILVGLGFNTNLNQQKWRRDPINLVAVVDKSGSMNGLPLDIVRESLLAIADQLNGDDQLTIVLYGSQTHVYMPSVKLTKKNKRAVKKSIKSIASSGSTYMEAGLKLGYKVAAETAQSFNGSTRVMLFTDERPNVGNVKPEGFMGLAQAGSINGIGLTTIGVGRQFGADLATKISSVRGGNLFFMQSVVDARKILDASFDFMVSELAYDMKITITPHSGYSIAGIYGVPGALLGWQQDRNVTITVPTIFLSENGGGIFFSLAKNQNSVHLPAPSLEEGESMAQVKLTYREKTNGPLQSDELAVKANAMLPSEGMKLGRALIDEFTALHYATTEHYMNNNQQEAYSVLHAVKSKLVNEHADVLASEIQLVSALERRFAFLSGNSVDSEGAPKYVGLWGAWKITNVRGGVTLKRGDVVKFNPESEFEVFSGSDGEMHRTEYEDYKVNEDQIYLEDSRLTFDYRFTKNKLHLRHRPTGVKIYLEKVVESDV